jgi:hypothetical protein
MRYGVDQHLYRYGNSKRQKADSNAVYHHYGQETFVIFQQHKEDAPYFLK